MAKTEEEAFKIQNALDLLTAAFDAAAARHEDRYTFVYNNDNESVHVQRIAVLEEYDINVAMDSTAATLSDVIRSLPDVIA